MSEVQDYHQPEEVELDKSDAPKDNVEFDLPQFNPIEDVAEPVHTGKGGLLVQMIVLKIAKISPALWVQQKLKPT